MPMTYRHAPDFRCLVHKTGNDYIGISYDRYQGADLLGLRIWRATGNEDEFHSLSHGLNLPVATFADAFLLICQVLGGEEEVGFPMSNSKIFRVTPQVWKGHEVIAARVYVKNKDGTTRPTGNGITLRRPLWLQVVPSLEETIKEFVDLDALIEEYGNAVAARVSKRFGAFL